jgi:DNA primase
MDWINFDDIKKAVSLEMVLQHYGIALKKVNGLSLRGKCPLPMHDSKTSGNSFMANLVKGVGGVWSCQSQSCIAARDGKKGGDTLEFVATMEGCSLREAAEKMHIWFGVVSGTAQKEAPPTYQRPKTMQLASKENNGTGTEENKPLKFALQNIDPTHPYLLGRGVTEEMARKFGVGHFSGRGMMQNRIVFEIHNEKGELVAYAGRVLDESEPRYTFPPGFHKSQELYNLHRVIAHEKSSGRRRVVLVEGFFPCLSVSAIGFPCVALMGNSMSKQQEELLKRHFDVVCILLDSNEVGQQGSLDCLARLGRGMYVYAPLLPEGKQPDTMKPEELYAFIKK